MTRRKHPPGSARSADASGRMLAPAAQRNLDAILAQLLPRLPARGTLLEIASGTGQHIAALAAHRPDLAFRPSDPDPDRRASIAAYCGGLPNVAAPAATDACVPGWSKGEAVEAILIVNLLHLISDAELSVLLDEVARALAPGGLLAIYGPFLRDGQPSGEADRQFDADLRAMDPAIGIKDIDMLKTVLSVLGLTVEVVEMPANNLMVFARGAAVPGL